jgi:hypothetical protein
MKLSGIASLSGAALITACASVSPVNVPSSTPQPGTNPAQPVNVATTPATPATPLPAVPHSGAWKFTYAPGTYIYTLTTDATVASLSDTTQKRQIPELSQQAMLTMSAIGDLQVINPVSGTSSACDIASALITRAQQLIPKIPDHFAVGSHWRDSTITSGCRGMIPATSQVISNYTVVGDTTFANAAVVWIHRTDSLTANGEGAEGQHRILMTATGTGATDLFFSTTRGMFVGSSDLQTSIVNVTTSGRLTQFLQYVKELVVLKGSL